MLTKQVQVLANLASLDEEEAARARMAAVRWQVSTCLSNFFQPAREPLLPALTEHFVHRQPFALPCFQCQAHVCTHSNEYVHSSSTELCPTTLSLCKKLAALRQMVCAAHACIQPQVAAALLVLVLVLLLLA